MTIVYLDHDQRRECIAEAQASFERAKMCQYVPTCDMTVHEWLAIRKKAALQIEAQTAEVMLIWAQIGDPYGIHGDPPPELACSVREYFARAPGSNVWVSFDDLTEATRKAFWAQPSQYDGEIPY